MLQHRTSSVKTGLLKTEVADGESVLRFDPISAVRGIVYHLRDEHLAKVISEETISKTIERLKTACFSPAISRGRWVGMSNSQRLEWLLSESQTITLVGEGDVVTLRHRKAK